MLEKRSSIGQLSEIIEKLELLIPKINPDFVEYMETLTQH